MAETTTQALDTVRFYFSFRSPYSWLALHRVDAALQHDPARKLTLEYIPVFPPPNFENDPTKVPAKAAYFKHDIGRIAQAYGLRFEMSPVLDCDWVRPHAAFLYAHDHGKGPAFAKAAYAARFSQGQDLGNDAVVGACAASVGLDAASAVSAQADVKLQERVVLGMIRGVQEDGIFGVPLFVYRGERFWGNDRIEWLLRQVDKERGAPVPNLASALLSPVHV